MEISLSKIKTGKNIRSEVDGIEELSASIASVGLLQPLVVRENGSGYKLIAGYRRLAAIQSLGWKKVPVHIITGNQRIDLIQTTENTQRRDLTLKEEILGVQAHLTDKKMTVTGIAKIFGHSEAWVRYRLQLANLCPPLLDILDQDPSQATLRVLSRIASYHQDDQRKILDKFGETENHHDLWGIAEKLEDMRNASRMKELPWRLEDERFGPACGKCTKRTSCQLGLFATVFSGTDQDNCIDEKCRMQKEKRFKEWIQDLAREFNLEEYGDLRWFSGDADKFNIREFMCRDEDEIREILTKKDYTHYYYYEFNNSLIFSKKQPTCASADDPDQSADQEYTENERTAIETGLSDTTKAKIYRVLFIHVIQAVWEIIRTNEPHLDKWISLEIITQSVLDEGIFKKMTEFRENQYHWIDCFTDVKEMPVLMFNFRYCVIRQYLLDQRLNYYVVDDTVRHLVFDEEYAEGRGRIGPAKMEDVKYNSEYTVPSIRQLTGFNFEDWLTGYMRDPAHREALYRCFTVFELLRAIRMEKPSEADSVSAKTKKHIVEKAVEICEKFPFYDLVFRKHTKWMSIYPGIVDHQSDWIQA